MALGMKNVENRSWRPQLVPGERFALHAGLRTDARGTWPGLDDLADTDNPLCSLHGLIIATLRFVYVTEDSSSPWAVPGMLHWEVDLPRVLGEPIQAKGQRNLWEFSSPGLIGSDRR
jgi:hypothetical protein